MLLRDLFPDADDADRCLGSIERLAALVKDPVAVTGSIAAGCHLLRRGIRLRKRLNDIDLVVKGLESLSPALSDEFLIRHFHPARGGGRILIMLVDQRHRNRIDIFGPAPASLFDRTVVSDIDGLPFRIVSAEDLLARLLTVMCGVTTGNEVDPKYVGQFKALLDVADLELAANVWHEHRRPDRPFHFEQAVEAVEQSLAANPALLQTGVYCQDIDRECEWCHETDEFPLAARSAIYEILGYV
ncbi:MAG TPA: hypothetical protein VFV34_06640 [Blastocatellia bacterium]|nr:hypothetical protein [Blastocatellia bacterium]